MHVELEVLEAQVLKLSPDDRARLLDRLILSLDEDKARCSIPDDCIDSKRYPLFMARSVMRALIEQLKAEARGVHRP